jgi:hypothetical protein
LARPAPISSRQERLPTPGIHLRPQPSTSVRDLALLAAVGLIGYGAAALAHHSVWAFAALVAAALAVVLRICLGTRARARREMLDALVEALHRELGLSKPSRSSVTASSWTRARGAIKDGGLRRFLAAGAPRRLQLHYAPGITDTDPGWTAAVLDTASRRLLATYRVRRHSPSDRRRCRILLELAPPTPEKAPVAPLVERATRAIAELVGPTGTVTDPELTAEGELTAFTVRHSAGSKLAAAGYRRRIEQVVSTMLPGRWRASWDLEADTARFSIRPNFPQNIWLPVRDIVTGDDILAAYDQVEIPYGVDEDGNVMVWRPAHDPNVMLVGAPGSGKSSSLDTRVPTPSGWTTMGELKDGDVIFDDLGRACAVLKAHPIRYDRPCYRITFSDGSEIVADAEHLWTTSTKVERSSRRGVARRRANDTRPQRMVDAQLALVRKAIEDAAPEDLISVPEAARLAGLHESAEILRHLRKRIPQAATSPRPLTDHVYREQQTRHPQQVTVFPKPDFLRVVAQDLPLCCHGMRIPFSAGELVAMAVQAEQAGDLTISSVEIRELFGGWSIHQAEFLMRRLRDLPRTIRADKTPRYIRGHVQRRRLGGSPVQLFPKRELLEAIASWGLGRHRDDKPTHPHESVRSTVEIVETLRTKDGQANHTIRVAKPVDCPERDVPLHPYALGVWLGDGSSREPVYTSADPEIAGILQDAGIIVVDHGRPASKTADYQARVYRMRSPVRRQLRQLGLLKTRVGAPTKRIPPIYLRASIEQRRELLAGLMDADGTVSPQGTCQFDNTNEQLARDVHELASSLGFRVTIRKGRARLAGRDCGPKWTVAWTSPEPVFKLERKQIVHKERTARCNPERYAHRYIVSVVPVPSVPVRCITVDSPSSLYLVGDTFIPTHNTVADHTILVEASRHGWPVWVVDGKAIEFLGFQDWPNVQIVATTIEEQVAVIQRAWEVMEHRYALITSGRARESDFEPLLLFLDEFADFRSNLMAWYSEIKVKGDPTKPLALARVASIARKGRTSRVHLVFSTQRPDAEYFGGDMRDNFRMRVSMGRLSPQGAMMMWESPATGTSIPRGCRGRATTINDANRPVEIQTYRTPDPRKTDPGSDEERLLQRLRPVPARHERLLILPPDVDSDLDTGQADEPTYRDYAAATWVLASSRPDLDPVAHRRHINAAGREIASPMAIFGLPASSTPGVRLTKTQAEAGAGRVEQDTPTAAPAVEVEVDDLGEWIGYGPVTSTSPTSLQVGDLVLVDDESGQWAVLDAEPEDDCADPGCIALSWRGDGDECGALSVPGDAALPVRHPHDLDSQE